MDKRSKGAKANSDPCAPDGSVSHPPEWEMISRRQFWSVVPPFLPRDGVGTHWPDLPPRRSAVHPIIDRSGLVHAHRFAQQLTWHGYLAAAAGGLRRYSQTCP